MHDIHNIVYLFFLLDRLLPAQLSVRRSASVVSYAAFWGGLTVDDRSYTNDRNDDKL